MEKEYISKSPQETRKIGENLSKKGYSFIGLKGDLGGGKTTFLQGYGKGLGIEEKILSPTFIIMRSFELYSNKFYHIDCYRLKDYKELLNLGFKEIISDPKNIIAVEWVDKIKKVLPKEIILVEFQFISEKERRIKISKKSKNKI